MSSAPLSAGSVGVTTTSKPARRYDWAGATPFFLSHVVAFGAIWSGVTWQAVALGVFLYYLRIFAVTAGYHRYFAHRTFETSRPFQFFLAWISEMSIQKGVLWWAAHHRGHHLHSDTERDIHSPKQDGFWHSHMMWLFAGTDETHYGRVKDLTKYPEIRWISKYWLLPPIATGVLCWLVAGWSGLFVGFFLSSCLNWHTTFFINSLCHVWGNRRFETKDTSRNNLFLALLTFGEGWHNNHHHYMNSARQGFYWWEVDITYYILKALSWVGLVWNLKQPPARVLEEGRRLDREAQLSR